VSVEDRAFRGGGRVSIRDRELLCMGSGGRDTGLLVGSERSGALKMLIWLKHICILLVHVFYEVFYF
jgi:hypothetical protein